MAEKVERRLTVIVSADVVAYARLIRADETGTRAALRGHREALIDPKFAEHPGLHGARGLARRPPAALAARGVLQRARPARPPG